MNEKYPGRGGYQEEKLSAEDQNTFDRGMRKIMGRIEQKQQKEWEEQQKEWERLHSKEFQDRLAKIKERALKANRIMKAYGVELQQEDGLKDELVADIRCGQGGKGTIARMNKVKNHWVSDEEKQEVRGILERAQMLSDDYDLGVSFGYYSIPAGAEGIISYLEMAHRAKLWELKEALGEVRDLR